MRIENKPCEIKNTQEGSNACKECKYNYRNKICTNPKRNFEVDFYVEDIGVVNSEDIGLVNIIPVTKRGVNTLYVPEEDIDTVWVMTYEDFQNIISNNELEFDKL